MEDTRCNSSPPPHDRTSCLAHSPGDRRAYPSPDSTLGTMRGYLVQPNAQGPFPAVLVIHENRGLNPYIEDVARRVATEGFLALAPDGLSPVGGYPGNDDDGRALQADLDQGKLRTDMVNSARFLKAHALSAGRLGVTGFCWGGSTAPSMAFTTTRHRVTTRRRPSWPGSGRSPSSRSTSPEDAASAAYSPIARGWRARGCKTSRAQPTSRGSPSQPGHVVRACR